VAEVLDRPKRPHPEQFLLACADEPFHDAVAFRRPHESRAEDDPQELEFSLAAIAHILAAMMMADLQPRRDRAPNWRRTPWRSGSRDSKQVTVD